MLVDLLTDPRQRSKPARAWTYDTKHHWPCHSVVEVNSLDTILVTVDEHHLELLFVKTSTADARLRARIIQIIGNRKSDGTTKQITEIEILIRRHF